MGATGSPAKAMKFVSLRMLSMTVGPIVKSGADDDGVAVREGWKRADAIRKTAGICGSVVQSQYGSAKSLRPVNSRQIS